MRPADARARETRDWFGKAADDIVSGRVLIASGQLANSLFFCQQAAEKSLKGFLTWHDRPFRRTHDLEELGEACRAVDHTLTALVEEADVLTEYAWKLRYPGSPYSPQREEAESMLSLAVRVFEEIKSRIPIAGG